MDSAELITLADRCEAATGPERKLDAEIAEANGMCIHRHQTKNGCQDDWGYDCDDCDADSWGNRSKDGFNRRLSDPTPAYTRSLDAAMTLILDGWSFRISSSGKSAYVTLVDPVCEDELDQEHMHSTGGATPALALCAAALQARAQAAQPSGGEE